VISAQRNRAPRCRIVAIAAFLESLKIGLKVLTHLLKDVFGSSETLKFRVWLSGNCLSVPSFPTIAAPSCQRRISHFSPLLKGFPCIHPCTAPLAISSRICPTVMEKVHRDLYKSCAPINPESRNVSESLSACFQRIQPPGMITAFPNQFTAMVIGVAQQLAPLHTDRYSSSKPLSAAARASFRLNSSASAKITRRLASNSSRDRSWALTPGTSSTQPIHQSPSRFRTQYIDPCRWTLDEGLDLSQAFQRVSQVPAGPDKSAR
jgi:hypothetical protein